jgi:transketolase
LDIVYKFNCGHIGGDFSAIDMLTYLFYSEMNFNKEKLNDPNRDRFVLSKGHTVECLYSILMDLGIISRQEFYESFGHLGTKYIFHPSNKIKGIEMNSGSLGHGLAVSVGMAIAAKRTNADYRTYVVMGDGEQDEGSVWEAAMAASHYKLDNLLAVVDRNSLQISGPTEKIMSLECLESRYAEFGWNAVTIDGHNFDQIAEALKKARETKGKPTMIISKTVKGKGVSFMENECIWHHKEPSEQEYKEACEELAEVYK